MLQDPRAAKLHPHAVRCLWNLDYALASGEVERLRVEGKLSPDAPASVRLKELEKQAKPPKEPDEPNYIGDLATWYLRLPDDPAAEGVARLAQLNQHDWRVMVAQDKLALRRKLKRCANDDERVALLIGAVTESPTIPVQGWAVRTLSSYPTEAAIAFLFKLYKAPFKNNRRTDLGLEAQEALRRLKRIPDNEQRFRIM